MPTHDPAIDTVAVNLNQSAGGDEAGIAMLFTGMRHFRHCATPFADLRRLPRDDL